MTMSNPVFRRRTLTVGALVATAGLTLAACGQAASTADESESPTTSVEHPILATHDGGVYILDGETLEVVADIELDGFLRLNPAGDGTHVLVSTSTGFRIINASTATATDDEFAAEAPAHVVNHADKTVLFDDATGAITVFDPHDLGSGLPETETFQAEEAHHGVAVMLESGDVLISLGDAEGRVGAQLVDDHGHEIARSEECPGLHGEAAAQDEAIVLGCQDGVLMLKGGEFTKIDSPDAYGRIGTQAGHEESPFTLGDYKTDPDAELERTEVVSIIDTASGEMSTLDLGTSYTSRSLARGPHGEGVVLGTDGAIHVIDLAAGEVVNSFPLLAEWEEPADWQEARPSIYVSDHTAYVSDPVTATMYAVDVESGEILAEASLPAAAIEVTGV
ncbi:hypothetical protein FB566_2270 [Stackebrandtia endophytica]|uniref:Secreted protein n=2 Tax=Stackebrandtia endophytica TaxID=1496996 RepID=A0A543AW01_9ACTN|nr:hypothetical protein FB566_2270 [Stackebrandtia endophytica]